ncbi:MAG: hypothetical protein AB7K24_20865, partial [Gemmataceae bacterium]
IDMTMRVYTKIGGREKRRALANLSYGSGPLAPAGVVDYPGTGDKSAAGTRNPEKVEARRSAPKCAPRGRKEAKAAT